MNLITKTKSTGNLSNDIQRLLDPLGGLANFIKPGDKVLLKPNFNTADPYPASSDPEFLKAVILLVKEAGAGKIILADSCTMLQKTEGVMECLNIPALSKAYGVEALSFDKGEFIKKKIEGKYLKSVSVPKIIYEVDKIILLPCLKTHRLARFTISLKMAVALMKKIERAKLHMSHLEEKIAELNLVYKPDLIILDGRKAFVTKGPSEGDLVEPNILISGTDRVAMDVEGVKILQSYKAENKLNMDPWLMPQIKRAAELGLGARDEKRYRVLEI